MFDSIRWLASGLNIFNLREPPHFRFLSLQGFLIYLLGYILVVYYQPLLDKKCTGSFAGNFIGIMEACKLGPEVVVVPFAYMAGSFVVISLIKKTEWSADAVFNNVSLLIVIEAVVTGLLYQKGLAAVVQTLTARYFVALSLAAVAVVGGISLLVERHTRPPKWTFAIGLRASPGIVRLMATYVALSAAYYWLGFEVAYR